MQINFYRKDNLSYAVIDEYFTDEEYSEVLSEVRDLKRLSVNPKLTASAKNESGDTLKTGNGVFVDQLYQCNRGASPLLRTGRKIFDEKVCDALEKCDVIFNAIRESNVDTMLINYYSPGEVYKTHKDTCNITAISLMGWGDFSGGGFCFPDQDITVSFKQGRTVVFPSCANHSSEPIQGSDEDCRVSVAHFMWGEKH